jgi:hypothetical protein
VQLFLFKVMADEPVKVPERWIQPQKVAFEGLMKKRLGNRKVFGTKGIAAIWITTSIDCERATNAVLNLVKFFLDETAVIPRIHEGWSSGRLGICLCFKSHCPS